MATERRGALDKTHDEPANDPDQPQDDGPVIVYLRGEGGGVIPHELPLQESVADRVASGKISRVNEDGSSWVPGDDDLELVPGSEQRSPDFSYGYRRGYHDGLVARASRQRDLEYPDDIDDSDDYVDPVTGDGGSVADDSVFVADKTGDEKRYDGPVSVAGQPSDDTGSSKRGARKRMDN